MSNYYSVIIPFHGNMAILKKVLSSLKNTYYPQKEIILVNDGSRYKLDSIIEQFQCRLINIAERHGPSFARNIGSREANFENLVFLDSDITIPHDCFIKINAILNDKSIDAVNCLVSADMPYKDLLSQYANIFFRYSILKEGHNTIFSSFCIIRAKCFHEVGGFNERVLYPYADDLILGWKLRHNGYRFALAQNIEAQHHKKMTPLKIIPYWLSQIYYMEKYFMVYRKLFKYPKAFYKKEGPFSAIVIFIFLYFFYYKTHDVFPAFLILFSTLMIINYKFLIFISKEKGAFFALKSVLIIALQQFIYSIGAAGGLLRGFFTTSEHENTSRLYGN